MSSGGRCGPGCRAGDGRASSSRRTSSTGTRRRPSTRSSRGIDENASLYVERGYQADDETLIAQLILIGLGAVLMIGGTLTATFLALSDARPDLATLSAVGASPRTRRGVASAYALAVGFVGAVLGAAVGFIPGIAITYPLTSYTYGGGVPGSESDESTARSSTSRGRWSSGWWSSCRC